MKIEYKKGKPFVWTDNGSPKMVRRYLIKRNCKTCGKEFYRFTKGTRFCSHRCIRKERYCPRKTHKIVKRSNGYLWFFMKDHPQANRQGYVYLHRWIAEQKIGRLIKPWEVVHHIDFDKSNNNPDNLEILSEYEHAKLHYKLREKWTTKKFWYVDEAHCEKVK